MSFFSARAADQVIATITLTNAAGVTNGDTLVINGTTRTWTNVVTSSPSTLIPVTNSPAKVTTNLLTHLGTYAQSGFGGNYGSSTSIVLRGWIGQPLVVSAAGAWAPIISFSTNIYTNTFVFRVPIETETATNRTNIASAAVSALSLYSTQYFSTNATALTNYLSRGPHPQIVAGAVVFTSGVGGTNTGLTNGVITGARATNVIALHGTNYFLFGGLMRSNRLDGPFATNLTVSGISSPSTNEFSEQFGAGAYATNFGTALGNLAQAGGYGSIAVGDEVEITDVGYGSVVVGTSSGAYGSNTFVFGTLSYANADEGGVIGTGSTSDHVNSIVIGNGASSTDSNQIVLGSSTMAITHVSGRLETTAGITNGTFTGTNQWKGDLAYPMYALTSLANGNNVAVPLTNVFVGGSGPTAAYAICGIFGGRDGRILILRKTNSLTMTIANESGVDPAAANRIQTGTGADVTLTNNPGYVQFIYNGDLARWGILSKSN